MARRLPFRLRVSVILGVLVLTAAPAAVWTLVVLSELEGAVAALARESQESIEATSALSAAVEREDDAVLTSLGKEDPDGALLAEARAHTDQQRQRLQELLREGDAEGLSERLDRRLRTYRATADELIADAVAPSERSPLYAHRGRLNTDLRQVVADIDAVRGHQLALERRAADGARDEIAQRRRVVAVVGAVSIFFALALAARFARGVTALLKELQRGARQMREGAPRLHLNAGAGDELGEVALAFNELAEHLEVERRQALREILAAKGTLEGIMAALPDGILLFDSEGALLAANPAASELFSRAGSPPPSHTDQLVTLGVAETKLAAARRGSLANEGIGLAGAIKLGEGGEARDVSCRLLAVPTGTRERADGLVAVLSDVTALARLDALRGELVAIASHELRTPVTTLAMAIRMLAEHPEALDPRRRALVESACAGIEQLQESVDELLDVTRIEAGELRLERERVDLLRLAREVTDTHRARAAERGVALSVRGRDDAPGLAVVRADPKRLRRVLDNLLDNALKYGPAGTPIELIVERTGPTAAAAAAEPARVVVRVIDRGPGVPEPFRERVFERFFRVEHHRSSSGQPPRGTGIGLYLCLQIVALHGGAIWCEPTEGGHGATFCVALPADDVRRGGPPTPLAGGAPTDA